MPGSVDDRAPSQRLLDVLLEETKRQLDASVQAVRDLDTRIQGLARFNAVLVGLVAAGLSLWSRSGPPITTVPAWILGVLAAGLGSALGSAGLAVWAYVGQRVVIGIDPEDLRGKLDPQAADQGPFEDLVALGAAAVATNLFVVGRSTRRLRLALASWILSLVLLSAGTVALLAVTNP